MPRAGFEILLCSRSRVFVTNYLGLSDELCSAGQRLSVIFFSLPEAKMFPYVSAAGECGPVFCAYSSHFDLQQLEKLQVIIIRCSQLICET